MIVARPQTETNQRAGIRNTLRLPAMIGLIAAQRVFTCLIPLSRRLSRQVVLSNKRFLNLPRPLRINFLLAPRQRLL